MTTRLGMVGDGSEPIAALLEGERKPTMASGVYPHSKELEQAHLCLGMAGVAQADPRRYPAYVLNTLLGGGMSSRLFQEIREKRGKAYSVYSFSSSYKDVGYLGVYAGTSIESAEEVVDLVVKELREIGRRRNHGRRACAHARPAGRRHDARPGVDGLMDEPYRAQ